MDLRGPSRPLYFYPGLHQTWEDWRGPSGRSRASWLHEAFGHSRLSVDGEITGQVTFTQPLCLKGLARRTWKHFASRSTGLGWTGVDRCVRRADRLGGASQDLEDGRGPTRP